MNLEAQKTILENTFCYLENYLNPNKNWDRNISPKERINQIKYSNVNWKVVSKHIKNMEYQSFLKTPYWKAIAAHTKYKAGYRCQVCNSPYDLVTHHRNYGVHGFEHFYIQDLTVLCNNCHSKFHNYLPNPQLQKKETSTFLIIKLMLLSAVLGHLLMKQYF